MSPMRFLPCEGITILTLLSSLSSHRFQLTIASYLGITFVIQRQFATGHAGLIFMIRMRSCDCSDHFLGLTYSLPIIPRRASTSAMTTFTKDLTDFSITSNGPTPVTLFMVTNT